MNSQFRRLTGFIVFCLISAFLAWIRARSIHFQPQGRVVAMAAAHPSDRLSGPPDPAWTAASSTAPAWPKADRSQLSLCIANPARASFGDFAQIMGLPETSVPFLRASIQQLCGKHGNSTLLCTLISRWAEIAPAEALEFALTLPPAESVAALQSGLPIWISASPANAIGWFLVKYREGTIPTGVAFALPSIGWQWGRKDLPGALSFLGGMEALVGRMDGPQRDMASGIGGLALQDELRDQVLSRSLDFAAAQGDGQAGFEEAFLTPLATAKPSALAAWMDAHPERQIPGGSIRTLLRYWNERDSDAAGKWAEKHSQALPE